MSSSTETVVATEIAREESVDNEVLFEVWWVSTHRDIPNLGLYSFVCLGARRDIDDPISTDPTSTDPTSTDSIILSAETLGLDNEECLEYKDDLEYMDAWYEDGVCTDLELKKSIARFEAVVRQAIEAYFDTYFETTPAPEWLSTSQGRSSFRHVRR